MLSLLLDAVGAVPENLWVMCMKVEKSPGPNKERHDLEVNTAFNMIS